MSLTSGSSVVLLNRCSTYVYQEYTNHIYTTDINKETLMIRTIETLLTVLYGGTALGTSNTRQSPSGTTPVTSLSHKLPYWFVPLRRSLLTVPTVSIKMRGMTDLTTIRFKDSPLQPSL